MLPRISHFTLELLEQLESFNYPIKLVTLIIIFPDNWTKNSLQQKKLKITVTAIIKIIFSNFLAIKGAGLNIPGSGGSGQHFWIARMVGKAP